MIYCDTSLLVALVTPESHTEAVLQWYVAQARELVISPWVNVEFHGAIAMKVRIKTLSEVYRLRARTEWRVLLDESLSMEPIEPADFSLAAILAGRPELKLRGGDALHLAIAADRGFSLATLDRDLLAAARAVGVSAEQIIDA